MPNDRPVLHGIKVLAANSAVMAATVAKSLQEYRRQPKPKVGKG
jgi:hypothetical protein